MKFLEKLDEQLANTAVNDEQRAARIAELTKHRRNAAWSLVLVVLATLAAMALSALSGLGMMFSVFFFALQFYQLDSELRILVVVDALRRSANQKAGTPTRGGA